MINDCEVRFFRILGNELFLARLISLIEVVPVTRNGFGAGCFQWPDHADSQKLGIGQIPDALG